MLSEAEFPCLARVIHLRREEHGLLLTAWAVLPADHWHAILFPRHPLTISEVMESIKVSSTRRINRGRRIRAPVGGPFFRSRPADNERVQREGGVYSLNPVKAGLVSCPEDWRWSSVHYYTAV